MADSSRDTTVTKEEIEDAPRAGAALLGDPERVDRGAPGHGDDPLPPQSGRNGQRQAGVVEFPASRLGKAAGDNALRAVKKCAPYKLPPEKSEQWSDVQLRLTPS